MKYILIYILNLADYILTLHLTNLYGIECEINPLMRYALNSDFAFAFIKLILFPLLLVWMWRKKKDEAAFIILGMFIAVVLLNGAQAFGLVG